MSLGGLKGNHARYLQSACHTLREWHTGSLQGGSLPWWSRVEVLPLHHSAPASSATVTSGATLLSAPILLRACSRPLRGPRLPALLSSPGGGPALLPPRSNLFESHWSNQWLTLLFSYPPIQVLNFVQQARLVAGELVELLLRAEAYACFLSLYSLELTNS